MTADYTRPGVEPYWEGDNPLAVGVFCPVCDTRLNIGDIHNPGKTADCPMGCDPC